MLIHVGKTGGNTVRFALKHAEYHFRLLHIKDLVRNGETKFENYENYIFTNRVSAFNWRTYLIVDSKTGKAMKNEEKFLRHWKTEAI